MLKLKKIVLPEVQEVSADTLKTSIGEAQNTGSTICAMKIDNQLLENENLSKVEFASVLFKDCKFKNVAFIHTDLTESNFFRTMLKNIDLTSADISSIVLSKDFAELRGATINAEQAAALVKSLGIIVEDC